jgi:WD40 repeat protein
VTLPLPQPTPSRPGPSPRSLAIAVWLLAAALIPFPASRALAATPLAVANLNRTSQVDFQSEILPVLRRNCLACHNQTRAKAELVLETPASILKGGSSGPAVVPGKPDESPLFLSAAHRIDDLVMPPPDNKANATNLTPSELAHLRLWIEQGARGEVRARPELPWQPIPTSWVSSYAVAIDRHAHQVACARANRVLIHDARSGLPAGSLEDPALANATQRDVVNALAFSPTDDLLATAGFREVHLWKPGSPRIQPILQTTAPNSWSAAALSPDHTRIALIEDTGRLVLVQARSGETLASCPAFTTSPALLAFSPDSASLAVVGASGTLRFLDIPELAESAPIQLPALPAAITWFDSGLAFAAAFPDTTTINVWHRNTPDPREPWNPAPPLPIPPARTVALATDPDGALYAAHADGRILRWTAGKPGAPAETSTTNGIQTALHTGPRGRIAAVLTNGAIEVLQFTNNAWSPPETRQRLAGNPRLDSEAATARLAVDLARLEQARANEAIQAAESATKSTADALAKAREKRDSLAKAHAEKEQALARLVEARQTAAAERETASTDQKQAAEERLAAATKAVADLEPQLQKTRIALDGGDQDLALALQAVDRAEQALTKARQAAETAQTRIAQSETDAQTRLTLASQAAAQPPTRIAPSPDGSRLLALHASGAAIAWTLAHGSGTPVLPSPEPDPVALLFPGPHTAVIVGRTRVLHIDFAPRWERVLTLGSQDPATAPVDRVNAIAFSPDGSLIATGGGEPSRSGEIKIWRVADGSLVRDLGPVHSDSVLALAFSPRGDQLASGGADRFARVSEVASGTVRLNLEGHTHHVMAVTWLAHGGVLASAGAEGVVKVWNADTGERLRNIDGFGKEVTGLNAVGLHPRFVAVSGSGQARLVRDNGEKIRDLPRVNAFPQALATSPDGAWAAIAADDGILRLWDLESGKERFSLPPP